MIYPLTTLDNVKQWLKVTTDDDDALLTRMILAVSNAIMQYIERPALARSTYSEFRDGVGNNVMMLKNWPAISVSSIQVSQASCHSLGQWGAFGSSPSNIPASASWGQPGYYLTPWDGSSSGQPQNVTLNGYQFPRGRANVQIAYQAGYCIQNEPQAVPTTGNFTLTPLQPLGTWVQDDGVSYANGTPMTRVSAPPTVAGTYAVGIESDSENILVAANFLTIPNLLAGEDGSAVYLFSAPDAAASVLLNYSYTPADIEQACIEWVAERYRYRDRIGQASKSLGGQETASYSLKAVPDFIAEMLLQYRRQFPV